MKHFFSYDSQRGMLDYFRGLLKGAAEFFHEELNMEVLEQTPLHLKLKLKFSAPILQEKVFSLNSWLGFTGSVARKISLVSFLVTLLPALFFFLLGCILEVFRFPGHQRLLCLDRFSRAFTADGGDPYRDEEFARSSL